ncbi:hypothetical protein B0H19DRAFT_1258052 [Mycena capillaripes]|nr:hypothetical protein B0H19DRAFT_1258052 [Mycena capillaripes]
MATVAKVVLTIPSHGAQVLADPSGALVLALPSGALVLTEVDIPLDLLPMLPILPDDNGVLSPEMNGVSTKPYTPAGERAACTLQAKGAPPRQCRCVIPCIRLEPVLHVVPVAAHCLQAPVPRYSPNAPIPGFQGPISPEMGRACLPPFAAQQYSGHSPDTLGIPSHVGTCADGARWL